MKRIEVIWRGPLKQTSGLGIAGREYIRALSRTGLKVKVIGSKTSKKGGGKKPGKTKVLLYHFTPQSISIKKERKYFNVIILNTVWETTRIPRQWQSTIHKFDAICVPTTHNKQALQRSGVKVPIYIAPHGVDTARFNPGRPKFKLREAKGRFVFLSVFGFQHRKNPEALLRAYWKEFSSKDKVLLVIKTSGYAGYETDSWIKNRIQRYKSKLKLKHKTAPIVVISEKLSRSQMERIYSVGDVFVLPTRGEGVGLPFLEALSSGIPVIATGWGGQMDFLTPKNSFLVRYKLKNPAKSMNGKSAIARPFRSLFAQRGQQWAEVKGADLRRQMRRAYENPGLCRAKGRQGRKDMHAQSWSRAGWALRRAVEQTIARKRK